jgi:gliding motility-associated-like protein
MKRHGVLILGVICGLFFATAVSGQSGLRFLQSFSMPQSEGLCGIAHNPYGNQVWVYGCNSTKIDVYDLQGRFQRSIPMIGGVANDVDLSIAPHDIRFPRRNVPAGSLLLINGNYGRTSIYAIQADEGRLIDSLQANFGADHVIGGAYHAERESFFLLQDHLAVDGTENSIAEVDARSGDLIQQFSIGDRYTIFYGDLEVSLCTGNLFIVTSEVSELIEFSPEGDLIREMPLPGGIRSPSGLSLDCTGGQAWISRNSSSFSAFLIDGLDCGDCVDCRGVWNGEAVFDDCDRCLLPTDSMFNASCLDCAGVPNGGAVIDDCGQCLSPDDPAFNQLCADCAGVPNGRAVIDSCGDCREPGDPAFNSSCSDCAGVPFGSAEIDDCGQCLPPDHPDFNLSCLEGQSVFIPNVFSPNGDGINDAFRVFADPNLAAQVAQYSIYDRWGRLIYDARNFELTDDAMWWRAQQNLTPVPSGAYVYQIQLAFPAGRSKQYQGSVTVMR